MGDFLQNSWLALLLTAAAAYLLGSINSAIIVTRLFAKEDIRSYGSGNAGVKFCTLKLTIFKPIAAKSGMAFSFTSSANF